MRFLKTYWISLLCGLVGVASVAGAVLGTSSKSVVKEMEKRISSASAINSLKSDPKNTAIIQAEQRRAAAFDAEYERARTVAEQINRREPLLANVFPAPPPDQGSMPFDFAEAYQRAIRRLTPDLLGGDLPSDVEIQEEQNNVEELLEREREQAAEGGETEPAIRINQPTERTTMMGGRTGMMGGGMMGGGRTTGRPQLSGDSRSVPKYDAQFRAFVAKAKSIRCYAGPATFHVSPIVDLNSAPSPAQMWFAQVTLWVQQDIVAAIADLNNQAAEQIADGEASVEHSPVKRIISIAVSGYQTRRGMLNFPARQAPGLSGNVTALTGSSFTERTCDDQFDVVRFTLTIVADQRDLLQIIDRIGKQNFYQCTSCEYGPVPDEAGYMYGTEPAVRAVLGFEGYMARSVYRTWMPPQVVALIDGEQK